jgi:membrane protein implicated in regulation of membrane protease activity
MGAAVVTFLAIGGSAIFLLALSLLGGRMHLGHLHIGHLHLGHLHLGRLHLGHLHARAGSGGGVELSMPVLAGFLGAFGFGGAIVASVLPGGGTATTLIATAAGLVAAVPTGWLVGRLVEAAMNMPTDATLTSSDLIGAMGVVVSAVPVDGYGEVRLAVAGTQMKLHARCDEALALGTRVFVISVPTPTSVLVEPTPAVD